jgi:predicted transcriptional regulator
MKIASDTADMYEASGDINGFYAEFGEVNSYDLNNLIDLFNGSGLTERESTILAYISLKGDTTANEIIAATGKKQSSVSQELTRLENAGLIRKEYVKTGKRGRPSEKIRLAGTVEETYSRITDMVDEEISRLKTVRDGLKCFVAKSRKIQSNASERYQGTSGEHRHGQRRHQTESVHSVPYAGVARQVRRQH